jgi:hypothetical protein
MAVSCDQIKLVHCLQLLDLSECSFRKGWLVLDGGAGVEVAVGKKVGELANHKQSLVSSSGGGGNRTSGDSPGSDDSLTASRTGIEENTSKEHEENALPDILVTMSQIPDVNRELAEVGAMFAVFDALRRKGGR